MNKEQSVIILAAGDGKRMNSAQSKVCCKVLFKPMLRWVFDACTRFGFERRRTCVILSGREDDGVIGLLPLGIYNGIQEERRGTGHAVACADHFLEAMAKQGVKNVCVLCGDAPFVDEKVLEKALAQHESEGNAVTVISAEVADPARYGRIVREGGTIRIVEAADATEDELRIREINSGSYWFDTEYLKDTLPKLCSANAQGEYYLTDLVGMAAEEGRRAGAYLCEDEYFALGANSREQLAYLNERARQRVFAHLYSRGVDIPCTDGVMIGADVVIGRDTLILPGTIIEGETCIGEGCVIGPNTRIIDSSVGDKTVIESSRVEESTIGDRVKIGPYSQVRPDCEIENDVKIGDFVEVKNSVIGEKTSLAHLTYIGDSDFGAGINVGCGVVTVNYDGMKKYRTTVEDGAFIGCNTNLIAPVTVGRGAYVAAATTVTHDVSPEALAIGRVRQEEKPHKAVGKIKKK